MTARGFLLIIILFVFVHQNYAQQNLKPVVTLKAIAFSPTGLSIEFLPIKLIGAQATFQRSIFRDSWRATADLKFYPYWETGESYIAGVYIGPYIRYKDVWVYEFNVIGKGCSGYCWGYNGYFGGLNAGIQYFYRIVSFDMNAGIGLSKERFEKRDPNVYYSPNYNIDPDLRLGISIGFWLGKR